MSYLPFPEEVLAMESRGQMRVPSDCQYPCREPFEQGTGLEFNVRLRWWS